MDNVNFYMFKYKGYHPSNFMIFRGIINYFLFGIFSVVLYYFSENGKEWVFSFLSNISFDYSGIALMLTKILYIVSFGLQKFGLLLILFIENPILASFSRLVFYLEPYISMIIMKIFYNENTQKVLLEIIFEIISGLRFLFTLSTSIELIFLPCICLNKVIRFFLYKREKVWSESAEMGSENEDIPLDLIITKNDENSEVGNILDDAKSQLNSVPSNLADVESELKNVGSNLIIPSNLGQLNLSKVSEILEDDSKLFEQ